mmetsp:Transcript_28330/g.46555  ORF Transcript_28330/g.46555 Transcript_28330/m.46555 type:complete len:206 (-) Transcript_28330:25-642(-)
MPHQIARIRLHFGQFIAVRILKDDIQQQHEGKLANLPIRYHRASQRRRRIEVLVCQYIWVQWPDVNHFLALTGVVHFDLNFCAWASRDPLQEIQVIVAAQTAGAIPAKLLKYDPFDHIAKCVRNSLLDTCQFLELIISDVDSNAFPSDHFVILVHVFNFITKCTLVSGRRVSMCRPSSYQSAARCYCQHERQQRRNLEVQLRHHV